MKQRLKKLCGTFLALSMLLTLLPVTALAADNTIDVSNFYASQSGTGWSYDFSTKLLKITGSDTYTITGSAHNQWLSIDAPDASLLFDNAIFGVSDSGIRAGGDVEIRGNSSLDNGGSGIYGISSAGGDVIISGGTVKISSSDYGISAGKNVSISGGTVELTSSIYNISASGGVAISGGTVTLKRDGSSSSSYKGPILSSVAPVITGGSLPMITPLIRPVNENGQPAYCVMIPLLPANQAVTALTSPSGYGITGVNTSDIGYLYFWLPEGNAAISLTVNGATYDGTISVLPSDGMVAPLTKNILSSFTDPNFRAAVLKALNKQQGDEISSADFESITTLDVSHKNIESLNGIEHFTRLTSLNCSYNKLTSLDTSHLTGLTSLDCSYNRLETLDLSPATNLASLHCQNNQLTSLNLTGTPALNNLQRLNCSNNRLTSLNIPQPLTNFNEFDGSHNWFASADAVTGLPARFTLGEQDPNFYSVLDITELPSSAVAGEPLTLTGTIFPADAAAGKTISFSIFDGVITGAAIENGILTAVRPGTVRITASVSGGASPTKDYIKTFDISVIATDITDAFTDPQFLEAVRFKLGHYSDKPLYLNEVSQITELDVSNYSISSLDGIEHFTSLQTLNCANNNLRSLDVSALSNLTTLNCYGNDLNTLNVSGLSRLTTLNCYGNDLTSLDVSGLSSLTTLNCYSNDLTSLDVSGLSNLTTLTCGGNGLTSLNATGLPNLETLSCNSNSLNALDVSGLSNLTRLECYSNLLPALNLTGLAALQILYCANNSLTTLDLTGLSALRELNCDLNSLTTLNVTGLSALKFLSCTYNDLPSMAALVGYNSAVTTALYFDPQNVRPGAHTVTVNGSYVAQTGAGSYLPGAIVSIDAGSRSGYTFSGWSSSTGISFANVTSAATTFTMPSLDITVTANWTASGSNGGDGGGASSTPAPATSGSTATTTVTPTVKNGAATASVPASQVTSALEQAQKAAKVSGETPKVEIKLANTSSISSVAATIPQASVNSLVSGNVGGLTVTSGIGSVSFDAAALTTISGASSGDVTVSVARVDAATLPAAVQSLVGSRPVYEFTVTGGGKTISQLGGAATVSVPYTLGASEDPNAVIVSYLNARGNLETVLSGRYDDATGTVTFTTTHFSKYSVGYNKVTFADVADSAWYADAVTYLAARGVTGGTTDTTFTPDATLTRGQFITLLLKAYGIEAIDGAADNFADAGSTYYTGYLAAAKQLGITSGVGNNNFSPTLTISRQQMFTLLYNALNALGQLPESDSGKTVSDFADSGSVAPYAQKAMAYLVEAGVVGGKNGYLLPQNSSTRAQMAQVLYNLLRR